MARAKKVKEHPVYCIAIERLDGEGRGVGHHEGKVAFVECALPGETVDYECFRNKPNFEIGRVKTILKESSLRVTPKCPNFGIGRAAAGAAPCSTLNPMPRWPLSRRF